MGQMARDLIFAMCFSFRLAAAFNHPNTTITRVRHGGALTPKSNEALGKEGGNQMQHNAATGSALLDTYLQFITENTFGKSNDQAHALKLFSQVYLTLF